ncbi:S1-like domain-containing RNA-binding protein [Marinicella sp. S1101]|uniref:CvfB family protein n=1 Tax=Marinicella marina TaxID=2996016 RepID=UPI0022608EE2|nr:S1-like domain-containing RNA-binding protein [Marinicella marina]MCX7553444.1 S1-like domain-containing RNA-binding protein [Marinicella marina]MDJ1140068.1 S1-like domain-containing RNA-binding protein [Marinicella marina]
MVKLGQHNHLTVKNILTMGATLDGDNSGDILLPRKHMPDSLQVGSQIEVFLYLDSDGLLTATTEKPKITVGQCAYLKVIEVNEVGAFLDWGLPKDLLLPYSEQPKPLRAGMHKVVCAYIDKASKRIVASARLDKHLQEYNVTAGDGAFKPGDAVDALFCGHSELGYKAVINNTHLALLHHSDVYKNIKIGQQLQAYIKSINADGKINLTLHIPNKAQLGDLASQILAELEAGSGVSFLTDKSSPEEIKLKWHVSKGSYKKAIGALYKQRKIEIHKDHIKLAE